MTDTIKTYQQLGRFVMNEVYNILLGAKDYKIEYKELKRLIEEKIKNNPRIDKTFAMHKLQHGSSKSYLCTYRWENVLYYYLMQHHKATFTHFEYWEDKKGVHDYIALRADYLLDPEYDYFEKFRTLRETGKFVIKKPGQETKKITSMFDWAQYLNKGIEDNYLHLIGAYSHLVNNDSVEQLLQEIKNCPYLGPSEIKQLQRKIRGYYSYLKRAGQLAEFRLEQNASILFNRENIKTHGGN